MKEERTDRLLREALGPVPVPGTVWSGLAARLGGKGAAGTSAGAGDSVAKPAVILALPRTRKARRKGFLAGGEAIPVLAAAASFCILFQFYLSGGAGAVCSHLYGYISYAALLAQRWFLLAGTFLTGGR